MSQRLMPGLIAAAVIAAMIVPSGVSLAVEDRDDEDGWARMQLILAYNGPLMAKDAGAPRDPSFWYIDNQELRQAMESDDELKRLYHEARDRRQWRRKTGLWLAGSGVGVIAVSGGLFMFSKTLNIPDDLAQGVGAGGAIVGLGLITPGIVLRSKESRAEKDYIDYVKTKYGVTPTIDRRDPIRDNLIRVSLVRIPIP